MNSMTGYGRGESNYNGKKIIVEINSLNRKQCDIQVIAPADLEWAEQDIRAIIADKISRGSVTVRITISVSGTKPPLNYVVNEALALDYARKFRELSKKLRLKDDLELEDVISAPGVIQEIKVEEDSRKIWKHLNIALRSALKKLLDMRRREGKILESDLKLRIANMRASVEKIKKRAPVVVENYKQQLFNKIKNTGLPITPQDEERLLKEVVIFADRSDISEEITRLCGHFKHFYECIKSKEPVGRTLDFLAQEMNREINTIGSKANDYEISREVVNLKTELEKFREQAQNIE